MNKPILHVFRGLPGSGKSTAANALGCLVFSPQDMIAMKGNDYLYSPENLKAANRAMGDILRMAAQYRMDIAIAEVLPKRAQVHGLSVWAYDHDYDFRVVDLTITFEESIQRNTHNVRLEDLQAMADAWEPWDIPTPGISPEARPEKPCRRKARPHHPSPGQTPKLQAIRKQTPQRQPLLNHAARPAVPALNQRTVKPKKRPSPVKDKRSVQRLKKSSTSEILVGLLGLAVAVETAVELEENAITAKRLRELAVELRSRIDPKPLGDGPAGHRSPRHPKPDLMADLQR